jgi:Zn-dependent protease
MEKDPVQICSWEFNGKRETRNEKRSCYHQNYAVMTLEHVNIVFSVIVFLFAISVHESAHAWVAWRLGDPTAFMLGRVTLNPVRHIDLFGTIILPIIAMLTHLPILGWAKPVPVNSRNFRHLVRDDILTSIAGPVSNFLLAILAVATMLVIQLVSPMGRFAIASIIQGEGGVLANLNSVWVPISLLLFNLMLINVVLGMFNLIPVPPLDGSHVLRHFLPEGPRRVYDMSGMILLYAVVFFGGRLLWGFLISPVITFFTSFLLRA